MDQTAQLITESESSSSEDRDNESATAESPYHQDGNAMYRITSLEILTTSNAASDAFVSNNIEENQPPSISPSADNPQYRAYKSRWYILFLFASMCCHQFIIWNSFGPIERGVRYAYPVHWNANTVAMMSNLGTIAFIIGVGPMCWINDKTGLRFSSLLSCGLMTVGAICRVFTSSDELVFLYTSQACSILNGFTGIIVMAAPAALSAAWFPANERATATAISQVFGNVGYGISFLLGPMIVTDNFLSKMGENSTSPEIPITNSTYYKTPEEEKLSIWYYFTGMAVVSVVIFIAMIIYFPSKPKTPPTTSASSDVQRTGFVDSIKAMSKDRSVMLCFVANSLATGVTGAWLSVMTVNFDSLDVGDKTSGYIGVATTAAAIVFGLAFGQFTDHIRRHIKMTLIILLLLSSVSYLLLTLLIVKVIPYNLIQLYIYTIVGAGLLTAISTLFFEYTVEMAYPVSEGIVGGLLTVGCNLVGCVFLSLFMVPVANNGSVAWMNYALTGLNTLTISLVILTKERYVRSDLDSPNEDPSSQNSV